MAALPHVEPVPATLLSAIDAVARERFGARDLRGTALAHAVRDVSAVYTRERGELRELTGDPSALCARLRFFVARDAPKIAAPLAELAAAGALPRAHNLRVLDLGAGLGTTSLGAARLLLAQPGAEHMHVEAIDQDGAALELGRALAQRYASEAGLPLIYEPRRAALGPSLLERLSPPYDLILLGFVLNELAAGADDPAQQHAHWLTRLGALLGEDGAIVVLEPALRAQSRALQLARARLLEQGGPPYLFAPCLHAGACPLLERERDWCHERLPQALPEPIAAIAREAGLREAELSYSYLTLCRAQRSLAELDRDQRAPERLYRVVSAPLASKGKLELALCGAGGATRARRLDRHASAANAALADSGRGQLLRFEPAAGTEPALSAPGAGGVLKVGADTRVAPVS